MRFAEIAGNASSHFDVAIFGAGPGGTATALALRRSGVERILLLDKPLRTAFRVGESATPDVAVYLARLGLNTDLETLGHRPYFGNLSLWGSMAPAEDDFLRRGRGHGWHLQRAEFDAWLRAAAVADGVQLWTPAVFDALTPVTGGWHFQVKRDDRPQTLVRARTLVDATGRRAALSTRLGVARRNLDRMVALALRVELPLPCRLRGRALVEAVRHGWWYAAALPDGAAMVMLLSDRDLVRDEALATPEVLHREWLSTRLLRDWIEAPPENDLRPAVFPAMSGYLQCAAGPGWLAVGDALLSMDPLTSSGIAGALNDAEAAAETIRKWLHDPQAWKEAGRAYAERAQQTLQRYVAERRGYYRREQRWSDAPFWRTMQQ